MLHDSLKSLLVYRGSDFVPRVPISKLLYYRQEFLHTSG